MSTAKDILDRCSYLLAVAKESDSRRVYTIAKNLEKSVSDLREYKAGIDIWNQEVVNKMKEEIEELAISLENVLAFENIEISCITEKRKLYERLFEQVKNMIPEVNNPKEKDLWLLMFGYAYELVKNAKQLMIGNNTNMQIMKETIEKYISDRMVKD